MQKQIVWIIPYFRRQKVFTNQKKLRKHFLNFLHYIIDIKSMMVFHDGKNLYIEMENKGEYQNVSLFTICCVGNF